MDGEAGPYPRGNNRRFMYRRFRRNIRAGNRIPINDEPIPHQIINNGRFYGRYHCEGCNRTWTSRYSVEGQARNCHSCSNPVYPVRSQPYVPAKRLRDRRMFGSFRCTNCNRFWKSGNSWQGYSQRCKKCGNRVYSYDRRPLLHGNNTGERKPHERELCEKCQELGVDCSRASLDQNLNLDI